MVERPSSDVEASQKSAGLRLHQDTTAVQGLAIGGDDVHSLGDTHEIRHPINLAHGYCMIAQTLLIVRLRYGE